ncbi:hypothetical protein SAMN05444748_1241 [Variovorax sp. OV700]|nr:hypothetical protein SAMN05444748_1241 [Variovorax sp. OV700]
MAGMSIASPMPASPSPPAHSSLEFDDALDQIEHYRTYPEMKLWVGTGFSARSLKLLVVGESHYLPPEDQFHLDIGGWYARSAVPPGRLGWVRTRAIIQNGINNRWKGRAKVIYRNIETALAASSAFGDGSAQVFARIAFMNFFQRPAEVSGDSIKVSNQDAEVANTVFQAVVHVLKPTAVVFVSSKASHHAKSGGSHAFLDAMGIGFARAPHPATAWWHRASPRYGNVTGKAHFIAFANKAAAADGQRCGVPLARLPSDLG